MTTAKLTVSDVRVIVPAKDFTLSKEFYLAMGWRLARSSESLALLELAGHHIFLQNYFVKEWLVPSSRL